jgi:nuclear polyadenylated RNA-binding protein NAB2
MYCTVIGTDFGTQHAVNCSSQSYSQQSTDPSFTDWLFVEAAKSSEPAPLPTPVAAPVPPSAPAPEPIPTGVDTRNIPSRAPIYQQAISQAQGPPPQKRTLSARSPSPSGAGHPSKTRRMDLPTGPRAMQERHQGRDRDHNHAPTQSRSLLERVSGVHRPHGPPGAQNGFIGGDPNMPNMNEQAMMMQQMAANMGNMNMPQMPNMAGMDMGGMANPMMLQEMMMNQMALMAQMATSMGIINPNAPMGAQFPGFQGQPGMGMEGGAHAQGPMGGNNRGRGGQRGRGAGRGRGGQSNVLQGHGGAAEGSSTPAAIPPPAPALVTPQPQPATAVPAVSDSQAATAASRPGFVVPERPQSPTLCKYGLKCTNALCRWSHPSPVATPESGVVLSNDPCEKGKDCKDADCVKAHVSPAVLNPNGERLVVSEAHSSHSHIFDSRIQASPPHTCAFTPPKHGARSQPHTRAMSFWCQLHSPNHGLPVYSSRRIVCSLQELDPLPVRLRLYKGLLSIPTP